MANQQEIAAIQQSDARFKNVRQDFLLYDVIRIGLDVPTDKVPGWYTTLTELADADVPISFFNQRQESETGSAYTNMKKKTGLDWHCIFTDFGIGWFYPDPLNVDQFDGDRMAAKIFSGVLPQHVNGAIYIGGADDKILNFRPEHAPYGFGPVGNQASGQTLAAPSSLVTMGDSLAGNRFQFANLPLKLPKDISVEVRLTLTSAAKSLLRAMNEVKPIVFENGTWNNEVIIVAAFRGLREVQQVGDWHR